MSQIHWTYQDFKQDDDLEQGDILESSPELKELFKEVHPHFIDDKYLGFMIVSQSCDLVQRKPSKPKTAHISLAVIRPLTQVINKIISFKCKEIAPGIFLKSQHEEAKRLLSRIFNQNEQAHGLFYLHNEEKAGLYEDAIAFVRVSISLRSEHYSILQQSRVGRLAGEYQNKLGWIVGNLYSRPAARDWLEREGNDTSLKLMISKYCRNQDDDIGPFWANDTEVESLKDKNIDYSKKSWEELSTLLVEHRPEANIDKVIRDITRIIVGQLAFDFGFVGPIKTDHPDPLTIFDKLNSKDDLAPIAERIGQRIKNNSKMLKRYIKSD